MSKKRAEITQRDTAHRQNAIILTGISIFLLLHFLIYNLKLKCFQIFIKAKHIFQVHKERFFYEFDLNIHIVRKPSISIVTAGTSVSLT